MTITSKELTKLTRVEFDIHIQLESEDEIEDMKSLLRLIEAEVWHRNRPGNMYSENKVATNFVSYIQKLLSNIEGKVKEIVNNIT